MWSSIVNSMGNPAHSMGPFTNQKREFSLNVQRVPIVPGKTFSNPNFVIKQHPSINGHKNNFLPIPTAGEKFSRNSISDLPSTNSALLNSSQSLVDALKEHHLDTVKTPEPTPKSEKARSKPLTMCGTKRNRRNRRNRRKVASGKNSSKTNTKKEIKDMMDVEVDVETYLNVSDVSNSPKYPNTFNLTDFIVNKPCKLSCIPIDDESEYDSDDEEFVATIISVSPLSISQAFIRERRLSIAESEDSFIIFNHGTDEELESSDETDTETEEDEEEEEDDEESKDEVDFISHAVPPKRVRFVQDCDLCEVHKMVQWSYAYQKARKGPWEEYARDRDRFNRRAADIEKILKPVFEAAHRDNVYRERFAART